MQNTSNIDKKVSFIPHDEDTQLMAQSINLLNEFKIKGFDTSEAFVNLITEIKPEFFTYKTVQSLKSFFKGRYHSKGLNEVLGEILNQLDGE